MKLLTKIIEVTRKDIDEGIPEDEEQCPISLALRREFHLPKKSKDIKVDTDSIQFNLSDNGFLNTPLPHVVRNWIRKFDEINDINERSPDLSISEYNKLIKERKKKLKSFKFKLEI